MSKIEQRRRAPARRVSLAVVTTVVVALFVALQGDPSSADVTAVKGSAFGYWATNISLFGGAQSDTGPTPVVTLPPNGAPQDASVPCGFVGYGPANLFTSDAVTVHTEGHLGPGGSVTSSASATNVNKRTVSGCGGATGSEILTADNITSTAMATESGVTGSTTITNGTYDIHSNYFNCTSQTTLCGRTGFQHTHPDPNPAGTTPLPSNPAPNTKVAGHVHLSDTSEDFYVIVLNEQTVNADGSITVNAVHEYFGAMLDANNNIVPDLPNSQGGSILHGDLIIGQSVAGVTATQTTSTTSASTSSSSSSTSSSSTSSSSTSTTSTTTPTSSSSSSTSSSSTSSSSTSSTSSSSTSSTSTPSTSTSTTSTTTPTSSSSSSTTRPTSSTSSSSTSTPTSSTSSSSTSTSTPGSTTSTSSPTSSTSSTSVPPNRCSPPSGPVSGFIVRLADRFPFLRPFLLAIAQVICQRGF